MGGAGRGEWRKVIAVEGGDFGEDGVERQVRHEKSLLAASGSM